MPAISLSPSFFHNELRAYADWRIAFWRELTQNAVDAKANNIWINFQDNKQSTGEFTIQFNDDGCGMNRSTLENVYFVLGETTKTDSTTIGGFGRARIITCFAHKSFSIHSQDSLCQGRGSYYSVTDAPEYCDGCDISIVIDKTLTTADVMEYHLVRFLSKCQISANVYINGTRFKGWTYKNRLSSELAFAKLYLNKSQRTNGVLIRVNGVWMFTRHTPATWQIVLEIDPAKSRETLTSNRDSLNHTADRALDALTGFIWVDPASAVRHRHQNSTHVFGNTVFQTRKNLAFNTESDSDHEPSANASDRPKNIQKSEYPSQPQIPYTPSTQQTPAPLYLAGYQSASESEDPALIRQHKQPITSSASSQFAGPAQAPAIAPRPPTPSYVHLVDCETPALIQAARTFLPKQISSIRLKLLKKWNEACLRAADHLAEITKRDYCFRTGFVFHEDHLAFCVSSTYGTGLCDLLLKPVNNDGLLAFKLSSKSDHARLLALAAHEAVHMYEALHNETFASVLTELTARLFATNPPL